MSAQSHIIFGAGPVAQAIMRELLRRGQSVKLVNHSGKRPVDVPAQIEVLAADLYDPQQVRATARGAAVVYQCAQPGYTEWAAQWPPLMKSILEGLTRSNTKLILTDNLYMYGDTDGQPLREDLPYTAHTRKGRVRAQVAEMALAAHRSGAVPVAIGRGSDYYGPGAPNSSAGERVFVPALQGKAAQLVGNIDLPHTLTYIEDFGKALVILGERPESLGQAWHVPNAPTLTQREWTTLLFETLGRPPKMSGMGKAMMRVGGLFIPEAREVVEMMYEFEKPFVVDSSKFIRAFGDHSTPHREALPATIAWYQNWLAARSQQPTGTATRVAA